MNPRGSKSAIEFHCAEIRTVVDCASKVARATVPENSVQGGVMGYRCFGTLIALGVTSQIAYGQSAPQPPPEVRKTVDAFAGHWTMTGTDLEPGAKEPLPVKVTIDCKPAALGAAVNCLFAAAVSDSHIEAAAIIGYSPDEHVVRWMEISSTGEYHDHHGSWKGNAIEFEPLTYTVEGAKMTEYFTPSFPSPGKMVWKWITETSAGKSRVDLTGTRVAAKAK
jgi:hypothetical protein